MRTSPRRPQAWTCSRHICAPSCIAIALFELRLEATRRPAVADALATWRRNGLRADIEFNTKMGLPGEPADIVLFHYALDGLILDQLTVPIDDDADPETLATTLAHRILQR